MNNLTQELLQKLKTQLGDYELADDDFYESEEIAELGTDAMFDYFLGDLDPISVAKIESFAAQSKLFLVNLVDVGEMVLAKTAAKPSAGLSWLNIKDLSRRDREAQSSPSLSDHIERSTLRFELNDAYMAAAASEQAVVTGTLPSGIDAEVFEEDGKLVIDLKTTDTSLSGHLVGFGLKNSESTLLGVTLLQIGTSGVISASIELDRTQLAGKYELRFALIEPADLRLSDCDLIKLAIERELGNSRAIAGWLSWIDSVKESDLGPEFIDIRTKLLSH